MQRHGGRASVRSSGGQGAEVHLVAPASMLDSAQAARPEAVVS
jgi:signal transduction histidine kinase